MGKDWLTVIIVLLMIGIALDGLRRMRKARRENLRLSRNAKKADMEGNSNVGSGEFPSGGARVASYREDNEVQNLNKTVKESFAAKRVTLGAPQRIPQQVALNLEESVPMLMDSVELEEKAQAESDEYSTYDNAGLREHESYDSYAEEETDYASEDDYAYEDDTSEDDDSSEDDGLEENDYHEPVHKTYEAPEEEIPDQREPQLGDFSDLDDEPESFHAIDRSDSSEEIKQQGIQQNAKPEQNKIAKEKNLQQEVDAYEAEDDADEEEKSYIEPDEVLIMNIMARSGQRFNGEDLLQALMDEGLKLGAMDIFHRHMNNDGDAPVLFSLANMVVPGTFNLSEMQSFQTPGISMFLSLPVEGESLAAYNDLARTARGLAEKLEGELKDENRSVMTNQTIEHGRQRVIEYERKKKLARV